MAEPTVRLRRLLASSPRWSAVEQHEQVTSTSEVAAERAAGGAAPGLVVLADRQTAGRGRAGRRWEDRPGGSLLVSVLLTSPAAAGLVPLAAGLATRGALCAHGADAELKWPNDVLMAGRKCAGILVERHAADEGVRAMLVVGIGVNVDWRDSPLPHDARWTSLAEETGRDHDRLDLLASLLAELDAWLDHLDADPAALVAVYRRYCSTIGRDIEVRTPAGVVVGTAADVDGRGALLLETARGTVAVTAGDVVHTRPR